jgi:hypothetical protein
MSRHRAIGAHLSEAATGYSPPDLRGTVDWRFVQFWMKTRSDQYSAELECRLGGSSALATGTAYIRTISFAEGKPPSSAPAELIFGGQTWDYPVQRGVLSWLFSIILTGGMILVVWRFILPASTRIPP